MSFLLIFPLPEPSFQRAYTDHRIVFMSSKTNHWTLWRLSSTFGRSAVAHNFLCLLVSGRNRSCRFPTKNRLRKRGRRVGNQVRIRKYRNILDFASCSGLPTLDVLAKTGFELSACLPRMVFIRTPSFPRTCE